MLKTKKLRTPAKVFIIIIIIALVSLIIYNSLFRPASISEDISITIANGSSSSIISTMLYDAGLTRNASVFKYYVMQHKIDSDLRAGTYDFAAGKWSLADISEILLEGTDADSVKVTIPEGLTVGETADIFCCKPD